MCVCVCGYSSYVYVKVERSLTPGRTDATWLHLMGTLTL